MNELNIWNLEDFIISGRESFLKLPGMARHLGRCVRWSLQRIQRGYADCDVWAMDYHLQKLLPDMLQHLKDNRNGSPGFLGENYTNKEGILVNDSCHAEWDEILSRMIFLWRESEPATCSRQNPYDARHREAFSEFVDKYGMLGEKLQTKDELEENRKRGGGCTVHFMEEIPKYKEIYDCYFEEEKKLDDYREECKDEAMDMLKEYFYSLWD